MLTKLGLRRVHRLMSHMMAERTNFDLESASIPISPAPLVVSLLLSKKVIINTFGIHNFNFDIYRQQDLVYLQILK